MLYQIFMCDGKSRLLTATRGPIVKELAHGLSKAPEQECGDPR